MNSHILYQSEKVEKQAPTNDSYYRVQNYSFTLGPTQVVYPVTRKLLRTIEYYARYASRPVLAHQDRGCADEITGIMERY